jgi:DNA-binding CsgD family transcriptional regulator/tetratricopeptide (TPR) repeat protein
MREIEATRVPATGSLLGRDHELARIVDLLETDTPIAIVGEAGVGKTTLARAAIRAAGRRSFEGGGYGSLAWAPFLAVERALGRSLTGADAYFAARELLRIVGDGVLFIDDLQWVDPASRASVSELVGKMGLVVGIRSGDPATDEAFAWLTADFVRVDLEPLEEADAAELARRVQPDLDVASARRVARRAGGNPLLVTELATGGEDAITLAAVIRHRLRALDGSARDAMTLLAIAGHPMAVGDLGPGAGRLASAGLAIVEADGRLKVRHELIATAAAEAVDDEGRRAVHMRLARLAPDPGEAARHHLAAGERELAHAEAIRAADAATTPGERAVHLEVAATAAAGPSAVELRLRAASALLDARQPTRALDLLTGIAGVAGVAEPGIALVEARAHRLLYDLEPARAALQRGLASLPPGAVEVEVRLHLEGANLTIAEMGPRDEILATAQAAYELAHRHTVETTDALSILGEARIMAGDLRGLDDLAAALAAASDEGRHARALAIGHALVFSYLKAGRAADGRALAEGLADFANGLRLSYWELHMRYWATSFAWHGGDASAVVAIAQGMRDGEPMEDGADWYEIQALADLGRFDEARIRAERTLASAKPGEYELGEALWLSADVAFLSGRWSDAVTFADRHAREVPEAHHRMFVELPAAWATVELGRPPTWPPRTNGMPIDEGGSIELEALRSMALGEARTAAAMFDAAAEAWSGRHARGERRCRWAAAESLRRAGQTPDAQARLLALEGRLEAASEVPMLARTHRSLRRLGVRRAVARQAVPGSTLTIRERQILELSRGGIRDGEIASRLGISRWAVVRSAESAAAKLGSTSRAEAVVSMMRL